MPSEPLSFVIAAKWPYLKGGRQYYASPGWTARLSEARRYDTSQAAYLVLYSLNPQRYLSVERVKRE